MKEDIEVNINAKHLMEDKANNHEISEKWTGKYYYKNDSHFIIYDSKNDDTDEKVSNTIKIKDNHLSIVKKGQTKTTLHFEESLKCKSDYVTPFGTFGLETATEHLSVKCLEDEMQISIAYDLFLDGKYSSNCNMIIQIVSKER